MLDKGSTEVYSEAHDDLMACQATVVRLLKTLRAHPHRSERDAVGMVARRLAREAQFLADCMEHDGPGGGFTR